MKKFIIICLSLLFSAFYIDFSFAADKKIVSEKQSYNIVVLKLKKPDEIIPFKHQILEIDYKIKEIIIEGNDIFLVLRLSKRLTQEQVCKLFNIKEAKIAVLNYEEKEKFNAVMLTFNNSVDRNKFIELFSAKADPSMEFIDIADGDNTRQLAIGFTMPHTVDEIEKILQYFQKINFKIIQYTDVREDLGSITLVI